MDIATIVGIIGGISFMLMGILLGGNLVIFIHVPSMLIVIGGATSAVLIAYPLADVLGVVATVKNAFIQQPSSPTQVIQQLVSFATKARREGILTLETEIDDETDNFLAQGVRDAFRIGQHARF